MENKKKPGITRKKKLILLISLITTTILVISAITYIVHLYTKAETTVEDSFEPIERSNSNSESNTSVLREKPVDPIEDNVSVLIIGVDDSEKRGFSENSRSDTLILATFNKNHNDIKLVSIPRDTHVYVPEVDYHTKINHAHAFGGPGATVETVEQFLNVPIDYYVRLNFEAFIEVVDTLGGIPFDVPFEISEQDSKDRADAIHLLPGKQIVKLEEALALARTRKYDGDLERGKRQQEIIKAVVKETASASSFFKLGNLMDAVGDNMRTNLSFDEMKAFVSYGFDSNLAIESINLDGHGGYLDDGLWYYQIEENSRIEIENELREHLELQLSNNTILNVNKME